MNGSCEWPAQSVQEDEASVENIYLQKNDSRSPWALQDTDYAGLYLLAWSEFWMLQRGALLSFPRPFHSEDE